MNRFRKFRRASALLIIPLILILLLRMSTGSDDILIFDDDIAMSGIMGVTPQLFGAKGDGTTNDTSAVQKAIDYASKNSDNNVVFIPEGTYLVRNLSLRENVILTGEGEGSVLMADPSCKVWDGILKCKNLSSVNISNITFDGNKPTVWGDDQEGVVNIWITSCSDVNIYDCTFQKNWYLGVCLKDSNGINIENNRFIDLDCGVLTSSSPSNDIIIRNNYFDGAEYSEPISIFGMEEGYHENILIENNIIKNHTMGSGILLRAVRNVTVRGNTIDNCGTGIYCTSKTYNKKEYGVYNAIIEDNTIINSVYEGILVTNLNDSSIMNNKLNDISTFAFSIRNANNIQIENNSIINNDLGIAAPYHGYAVSLTNLTQSKVINNTIDILGSNVDTNRKPITIGNDVINNVFSGNVATSSIPNIYKIYSTNNIFD